MQKREVGWCECEKKQTEEAPEKWHRHNTACLLYLTLSLFIRVCVSSAY